jgi:broad specificity phosphatase PhoE
MKKEPLTPDSRRFYAAVARAMKRAMQRARETARAHGTPLYVWEDGKIVAKKP